jgi:hypothetical protein
MCDKRQTPIKIKITEIEESDSDETETQPVFNTKYFTSIIHAIRNVVKLNDQQIKFIKNLDQKHKNIIIDTFIEMHQYFIEIL